MLDQFSETAGTTELFPVGLLLHDDDGEILEDASNVLDDGRGPRGAVVGEELDELLQPLVRGADLVSVLHGVGRQVPEGTGDVLDGLFVAHVSQSVDENDRCVALEQRVLDVGCRLPGEVSEELGPTGDYGLLLEPQVVHEGFEKVGEHAEGRLVVHVSVGQVDQD